MYEKFFYLNEKPFHITPNPKFLYMAKYHRIALDLLTYGINDRKGFILFTGEVGTGKTTICRALMAALPKSVDSALIMNPLMSDTDLLQTITQEFGVKSRTKTVKGYLDALNKYLIKVSKKNGTAALIIDEAQNLPPETLETIRMLSNLETDDEKLIQIVLVGQPELKDLLKLPSMRQLNQRIVVRCHLEPLGEGETESYIQTRLFVAGGRGTVRFTDDAINAIFNKSNGIPRLVNIICDRALTAAFVDDKREVDKRVAVKAMDELELEGYFPEEEMPEPEPGPVGEHGASQTAPQPLGLPSIAGLESLRYMPYIAVSAIAIMAFIALILVLKL